MFYCFYVAFSLFHSKVLNKVGLRVKYLGASVSCCVFMLSLVLSESVIVFFANTVTIAVFRSAVYTISFILSDKHVQKKFKESTDNGKDRSSSSQSGFVMASVTAMIPASNFVVNLVMGPLKSHQCYRISRSPDYFCLGVFCTKGHVHVLWSVWVNCWCWNEK